MRYDSKRDYNVTLLIKTPEKHVLYKFLNPSDKKKPWFTRIKRDDKNTL